MTIIGPFSSCRPLWHLKDIKRLFLVGPDPVFRDEDVYISVVLRTDLRRTCGLVMMLWCCGTGPVADSGAQGQVWPTTSGARGTAPPAWGRKLLEKPLQSRRKA